MISPAGRTMRKAAVEHAGCLDLGRFIVRWEQECEKRVAVSDGQEDTPGHCYCGELDKEEEAVGRMESS